METLIEITEKDSDTTLADAKRELLSKCDDGTRCPCCNAYTQAYRRNITSSMAIGLTHLIKNYEVDQPIRLEQFYMDVIEHIKIKRMKKGKQVEESIIPRGSRGNIPALRFWGLLIQIDEETRPDGNKDGNYVLTQKAFDFVHKKIKLPRYAVLYNGEFKRFEGEDVGIGKALTKKFNLSELINFPKEEKEPELNIPPGTPAKEPVYPPKMEEKTEEMPTLEPFNLEPEKCIIETMGMEGKESFLIANYTRQGPSFLGEGEKWVEVDEAKRFGNKGDAEAVLDKELTGV